MARRRYRLAHKLHECNGTIGPDGTGEVWSGGVKVRVALKVTKRHPRGELYDASGKAYEWPVPERTKESSSNHPSSEFFAEA